MENQSSQVTQTYTHYAAVVIARGIAPMTEEQFAICVAALPRVTDVQMPHTLNYAIGVAMEAGDMIGAGKLIAECEEHDKECWSQYTTEGDHFPAEGLHLNISQWSHFNRVEARPLTVAYMLDHGGELPGSRTFFKFREEQCFFNEHSVCVWDDELGWDFLFHHKLADPTVEQIIALTKPHYGEQ